MRQHKGLAERYERMRGDLGDARQSILDAQSTDQLRDADAAAASLVSAEAGDWFGTMWFLDVDQPGWARAR